MNDRIANDPHSDSVERRLAHTRKSQEDWNVKRISSLSEMAVVIEAVVPVMAGRGYAPRVIFGARLALEEAICNALKHGHQYDPTKVVEVSYLVRADHALVEVEDQGAGFDPSQIPDATSPENLERPSGRGLLLMRYYAAWVRHNRKGNCVTFCICRSAPLPSQLTPGKICAPC